MFNSKLCSASPCSTEWIDAYYKHICGKLLMVLNLIRTRATESTETASSETSNKARLIYYMATKQSIEYKGIYL